MAIIEARSFTAAKALSEYVEPPWWQKVTGYQIWPRSFCDSNGDGIGDIPGIISKLDYLADLGIGLIWLSPVYASPMVDNGYDIADYQAIAPQFGTLEDLDQLVASARARGIRIVMDLVVNHSSDQHRWFQSACTDTSAPEHEYYIWREANPDGSPFSHQKAVFGGSVWNWVPEVGKYYYAHFSAAQPDLNWQNSALRSEIYDMMNWWLDRGIAGFRMDVISLIGKDVDAGIFEEGPHLHSFLQEMHQETLAGRDVMTVGESWSVSPETALFYCGRDRGELDMVFQFNHVTAFEDDAHGKWSPKPFDLVTLKKALFTWQDVMAEEGWNSLFLSNHDLPRAVSTYGDPDRYRLRSAKLLATVIHLMRGTPFIYQGEEIGMTNAGFSDIGQFRDVETLRHYADKLANGMSPEVFLAAANRVGRDNARTPVQWSDAPHAGFTRGTPWIGVNENYHEINADDDRANPKGLIGYYRQLTEMRRNLKVVSHGRFFALAEDHPQVLAYTRECDGQRLSVVANFGGEVTEFTIPTKLVVHGRSVIHNVTPRVEVAGKMQLAPWESFAVLGEIKEEEIP